MLNTLNYNYWITHLKIADCGRSPMPEQLDLEDLPRIRKRLKLRCGSKQTLQGLEEVCFIKIIAFYRLLSEKE